MGVPVNAGSKPLLKGKARPHAVYAFEKASERKLAQGTVSRAEFHAEIQARQLEFATLSADERQVYIDRAATRDAEALESTDRFANSAEAYDRQVGDSLWGLSSAMQPIAEEAVEQQVQCACPRDAGLAGYTAALDPLRKAFVTKMFVPDSGAAQHVCHTHRHTFEIMRTHM
jgi:hypothetical protein